MKKNNYSLAWNSVAIFSFVVVSMLWGVPAHADAVLEVEPITWNVIGLASNDVDSGPNHFPVGVRICNTGDAAATNVEATFVWDDGQGIYTGDLNDDDYI